MKISLITFAALAAFAPRVLREKPDEGFGAVTEALDTTTREVKSLKSELDKKTALIADLTANVDRWQKENKKTMEDLTQAKNHQADDIATLTKRLAAAQHALRLEKSLAFGGTPIQRASRDPEFKALLNVACRLAASRDGKTFKPRGQDLDVLKGMGFDDTQLETKALNSTSTPGSVGIVTALSQKVYDLLPEYGIWSTLGVEPLTTRNTTLVVDTADPVAKFYADGASIDDDSTAAATTVTATAKKIAVMSKVSSELLADSELDITSRILRQFLRAIAYRMDFAAFRADGTDDATNGEFTGVFNFGTVYTAASGNTTVETLDFEDVTATIMTPGVAALTRMSRWWMHPHILTRLLHIKDSNGRPIFLTSVEAPAAGGLGSILGYPVTLGNVCPSTNSAGQKLAAFGDPDSFAVGIRQDVTIASSDQVYFASDQVAFRGIARAAFKGRLATALGLLKTAAS